MGSRPRNSNRPRKSSRQQRERRADAILASAKAAEPARTAGQVKRTARRSPPDLAAILGDFSEAYAMIVVSQMAVAENDHSGPESVTLRLGVEALDRAYNQLDVAILQLEDVCEKGAAKRGAA